MKEDDEHWNEYNGGHDHKSHISDRRPFPRGPGRVGCTALTKDFALKGPRDLRSTVALPEPYCQRDPAMNCWPSGCLDAWDTKAKKPHVFKSILVFGSNRRRRQSQQTDIFINMCGFWPWYPRPPTNHLGGCFGLGAPGLRKTTWPKKHFGMPLNTF